MRGGLAAPWLLPAVGRGPSPEPQAVLRGTGTARTWCWASAHQLKSQNAPGSQLLHSIVHLKTALKMGMWTYEIFSSSHVYHTGLDSEHRQ